MIKYLKNIILIENWTLFHVKKSVKMQNLTKITKNCKNWPQKMLMEPRDANCSNKNCLKLFK
jgi:hypothetical protein